MADARAMKWEGERVAIARHLSEHGPTGGTDLAGAIGLSLERFWVLINCPWFEITGTGWELTETGKREWERTN